MPENAAQAEPSLTRVLFSSLGLAFVALICAASGLAFGLNRSVNLSQDWVTLQCLICYAVLICPYLFSRYASLEGMLPTRRRLLVAGLFVPLGSFILLTAIFGFWVYENVPTNKFVDVVIPIALSLLVFLYLGARMLWSLLRGDDDTIAQERQFKNKVLVPAFATCLVSFTLGWATVHPSLSLLAMLIPCAVIGIGRELISARHWTGAILLVTGTIVAAFAVGTWLDSQVGTVILVGAILTLAMGVAEVCKRVVWLRQHHPVLGIVVGSEDAAYYLAGANWSSVIFPLLVSLLPLVISGLAVFPIFLILSVQYLHWQFFTPRKTSRALVAFNILLGFLLPLVIGLQNFVPVSNPLKNVSPEALVALAELSLAAYALYMHSGTDTKLGAYRESAFRRATYLDPDNCLLLFLTINFVLILLLGYIAIVFGPLYAPVGYKAKEIIAYLLALAFIVAGIRTFQNAVSSGRSPERLPGPPDKGGSARSPSSAFSNLTAILQATRWPVALIAGIPTLLLLLFQRGAGLDVAVLQSVPIVATTMLGFLLNDMFDLEKDSGATQHKPLVACQTPKTAASAAAIVLVCIALACTEQVVGSGTRLIVYLAIAGVIVYSPLARVLPVLKGVLTALLSLTPFAYATTLVGISIPWPFYLLLSIFIFARELLLDIRDLDGDIRSGIKTLAYYVKPITGRAFAWSGMICAFSGLVLLTHGVAFAFMLTALLSLLVCMLVYSWSETIALGGSRIAMLLAAIGAVFIA